jgi:hypothetical protein
VDIKVLSTGNMSSILADLGKEFERANGDKLAIEHGSTTRIKSRVEADEAADLFINEPFVLEDLLHQARIANGTLVDIARSPLAFGTRLSSGVRPSPRCSGASKDRAGDYWCSCAHSRSRCFCRSRNGLVTSRLSARGTVEGFSWPRFTTPSQIAAARSLRRHNTNPTRFVF